MSFRYSLVAVLGVTVAVFAVQNNAPTQIRLLFWALEAVPLATVVLLSVAVGILLVGPSLLVTRGRLRAEVRGLEAKVTQLENALAAAPRHE